MSFLYDYRGFVLFFIIMIETLFTITIFDKVAAASLTMRLLESITDMLGIMFTIYLFYHTLVLERKIVQRKNIEEKTKIAKVEYDLTEATWNINKEFMACFDVEEAEISKARHPAQTEKLLAVRSGERTHEIRIPFIQDLIASILSCYPRTIRST